VRRDSSDTTTVAAVALAVIGVACCAGLPAIAAVLGGITVAAVLGVAGGILAVAGLVAAVVFVVRLRRRRACTPPDERTIA
jgi:hypothetical protein